MKEHFTYFFAGRWYLSVEGQLKICPETIITQEDAEAFAKEYWEAKKSGE